MTAALCAVLWAAPASARAVEDAPEPVEAKPPPSEPAEVKPPPSEPAEPSDDMAGFMSGSADEPEDALEDDEFEDDELEDEPDAHAGHSVLRETIPVPAAPPRPRRGERSGRGMLIAGASLLGLVTLGRAGLEAFWAGPAQLEANEPFGRWSIPGIVLVTNMANVFAVPGVVLTGLGARRRGKWRYDRGLVDPSKTRLRRAVGWGLLGGGLGLWAVTRAAAPAVLRSCETNGCVYGYIESTLWLSLGTVVPGVVLVGFSAGERGRGGRRISAAPLLSPSTRGLALGGRF